MSYSNGPTGLPDHELFNLNADYSTGSTAVLYAGPAARQTADTFLGVDIDRLRTRSYDAAKRVLDILLSTLFLAAFSPVMLLSAAAILIEDGGPIIFRQTRIGRNGKPFRILKFRTLRAAGFDAADPNGSIECRALRVGRILRRTHLDEVLQFFNVLTGSMSIIGPRPEMPFYHERASAMIPAYARRLIVKPGITGWAQTHYGHTSSLDEYRIKTGLDLFYVRNRSLTLDLRILARTASTLLAGSGAR